MVMTKDEREALIGKYQKHPNDRGSTAVRRRLLRYLNRTNPELYRQLVDDLGLRG